MFDPMLQRRVQADNLRKRLTFYEQNKFIFNLPAMLRVAIAKVNRKPLCQSLSIFLFLF